MRATGYAIRDTGWSQHYPETRIVDLVSRAATPSSTAKDGDPQAGALHRPERRPQRVGLQQATNQQRFLLPSWCSLHWLVGEEFVKAAIIPIMLNEACMGAFFDLFPVSHDENPIDSADCGQAVRDQNTRATTH